jgi:hypothetical protein
VLAKQQRFEEALDAFRTALPEPDAFYNLALMFRGQHRYQDAADALHRVLALNPDFSAAKQQLEVIAPQLALSTPIEPVADVDEWPAVADATQVDEATPVEQDPQAPDDESVATLTSAETLALSEELQLDAESPGPGQDGQSEDWGDSVHEIAVSVPTEVVADAGGGKTIVWVQGLQFDDEPFGPCWDDDDADWLETPATAETIALADAVESITTDGDASDEAIVTMDEPAEEERIADSAVAAPSAVDVEDDTMVTDGDVKTILWMDGLEFEDDLLDPCWEEEDTERMDSPDVAEADHPGNAGASTPSIGDALQTTDTPVDEPAEDVAITESADTASTIVDVQDETDPSLTGTRTILWTEGLQFPDDPLEPTVESDQPALGNSVLDWLDAAIPLAAAQDEPMVTLTGAERVVRAQDMQLAADSFDPGWDDAYSGAGGVDQPGMDEHILAASTDMFGVAAPAPYLGYELWPTWWDQLLAPPDGSESDPMWGPVLWSTAPELVRDESIDSLEPCPGILHSDP